MHGSRRARDRCRLIGDRGSRQGFHAPLQWLAASSPQEALTAALHEHSTPKGFVGELSNLRTPFGLATISSGTGGLSIKLQQ